MKTSYFYQLKNLTDDFMSISIALTNPDYLHFDLKLPELAPDYKLLRAFKTGVISEEEYIKVFNKQLDKLKATEIYEKILSSANGRTPVLLCHCGKERFCHRHLVADWFESELGITVSEFGLETVKRSKGRLLI